MSDSGYHLEEYILTILEAAALGGYRVARIRDESGFLFAVGDPWGGVPLDVALTMILGVEYAVLELVSKDTGEKAYITFAPDLMDDPIYSLIEFSENVESFIPALEA
jgi:hypothetical protein